MAIIMTVATFERQWFIIQFLIMMPFPYDQFDCFRKPCFQIYFYTDTSIGVIVFRMSFINVLTKLVSDGLHGGGGPGMDREVGEMNPYRD